MQMLLLVFLAHDAVTPLDLFIRKFSRTDFFSHFVIYIRECTIEIRVVLRLRF